MLPLYLCFHNQPIIKIIIPICKGGYSGPKWGEMGQFISHLLKKVIIYFKKKNYK